MKRNQCQQHGEQARHRTRIRGKLSLTLMAKMRIAKEDVMKEQQHGIPSYCCCKAEGRKCIQDPSRTVSKPFFVMIEACNV
mmetsp:Transcript_19608/g.48245  ORF Transcript_19608/g.48245 Transcript_19608/m.48245 type:complete len:81 (-) Transcript_19608:529-771(-)